MMDDLISRQEAIDALGDMPMSWADTDAEIQAQEDWKQHREALLNLPAVEIVHCEECIYYENENSGLCDLGGSWDPDDYCSNGRRYKHG